MLIGFFGFFSTVKGQYLIINIPDIKENGGNIELGLYNNPESWLSETEQYRILYRDVDSEIEIIVIDSLPPGWYAISLMHDLNGNGEMERNFIRYPKEPFAFSNNIKPLLSAPGFDDCKFYFSGETKEMKIKLLNQ